MTRVHLSSSGREFKQPLELPEQDTTTTGAVVDTKHTAKLQSPLAGICATPGRLLRLRGSGAPATSEARLQTPRWAVLGATLLGLLVPLASAASAEAAPPTVTIQAPSPVNAGTGHYRLAGHVNPGGLETEWSFSCTPSCSPSGGASLPGDEEAHQVASTVTGLAPNTTYIVTLTASNTSGSVSAQTTLTTPSAATGVPWWHLETSSRPTFINPDEGEPAVPGGTEIQEIKVVTEGFEAENGEIIPNQAEITVKVAGSAIGEFATEHISSEFGITRLTSANLLTALEGPYGPGNVQVEQTAEGATIAFKISAPAGKAISLGALVGQGSARVVEPGSPGIPATPDGEIYVTAENVGNANLDAAVTPVTLKDVIPSGLEAVGISATEPAGEGAFNARVPIPCNEAQMTCEFKGTLAAFDALEMRIAVNVVGGEGVATNEVTVSGGGAPARAIARPITISSAPLPFGVHEFEMALEEEGGAVSTHAAAHPFQFTTQITLNQGRDVFPVTREKAEVVPVALAKDADFNLPPGLIGNPSKLTKCTAAQFFVATNGGIENHCPASSALGVAVSTVQEPGILNTILIPEPIFNMEPNFGEPARFGFNVLIANAPVFIDTAVRSEHGPGGAAPDYGVTAEVKNITQAAGFLSSTATFWGVPGAASHDGQRGWGCFFESRGLASHSPCLPAAELHPPVLFSNPTSCAASLQASVDIDSWDDRTFHNFPGTFSPSGDLNGCNQVPFAPSIKAEPTSNAATSPTGLNFDINVNDEGLDNAEGFVQSQIKKAVVTLPEGFTTNPSVAEGLKACTKAQYESETVDSEAGSGCPNESKIGDVEIESPLIEGHKVLGSLYVAKQGQNPYGNLLTIYMVAKDPELGVMVRQALKVTPNPVTGQLTTEVDDIPQLPFSRFHLSFRQGQRSPLVTPPTCGTYTVTADLYPYSEPATPIHDESSFQITTGPEGKGCPAGVPPFHPELEAGTINNAAGTYSPFYTRISRKDSEQEITRFSIKLPTGLLAKLKGVSECSDAAVAAAKAREHEGGATEEEAAPSCSKNSEVGHSTVGTGVGNVLAYAGGKLYLAGPYHGSPISLVSVNYAKVGPFDLGTVVVRFAFDVNHETAEVSVDGANSDPIPHIVDGIPIHLRDIRAYVNRPNFTLNPTSCAKKSTAATVLGSGANFASSSDDVPVTVSSPFQAADCASLGFKPKLALSLTGKKTHRGALPAFKAVLTYPKKGAYANIAKAQVTLPESEYLEQGHLKDVCTRKQFESGTTFGENCPAKSIYGKARAVTPLLGQPLEGPVYLRTGYGTKLPELAAALNGPQISIDLAGKIDSVHKKGTEGSRIRNTFSVVPDAPVERFVLELKGGKKGLLVNSTDVCKGSHHALAAFTGQNGKLDEYEPALEAQCGKGKGAKKKSKGAKKAGH